MNVLYQKIPTRRESLENVASVSIVTASVVPTPVPTTVPITKQLPLLVISSFAEGFPQESHTPMHLSQIGETQPTVPSLVTGLTSVER